MYARAPIPAEKLAPDDRWRERYLAELERLTAFCTARGLPFKWAMIQAIRRYMRWSQSGAKHPMAKMIQGDDGRDPWPTMNACARALGVAHPTVYKALKKGHRCKGVQLRWVTSAPRRLDERQLDRLLKMVT